MSVHIAQAGFSAWSALSFILQLYRLLILQGPAPKSLLFKILLDSPNPLCSPVTVQIADTWLITLHYDYCLIVPVVAMVFQEGST